MNTALIDALDVEIVAHERRLEELKALRAKLLEDRREVKAARDKPKVSQRRRGPSPKPGSIMEGVMMVLGKNRDGLQASEVLANLRNNGFPSLERTSLSPQLSRLKQRGYVTYKDKKWSVRSDQLPLPYTLEER